MESMNERIINKRMEDRLRREIRRARKAQLKFILVVTAAFLMFGIAGHFDKF